MDLIKFRIFNYKSINDSGICWLSPDLTILAGKNESGKTAILEALKDFHKGIKEISHGAYPLDSDKEPSIEMYFTIDKLILKNILEEIELNDDTDDLVNYILQNGISFVKNAKGKYTYGGHLSNLLNKQKNDEN